MPEKRVKKIDRTETKSLLFGDALSMQYKTRRDWCLKQPGDIEKEVEAELLGRLIEILETDSEKPSPPQEVGMLDG